MIEIKTENGSTSMTMSGDIAEIGADSMCVTKSILDTVADYKEGILFEVVVAGMLSVIEKSMRQRVKE